MLCTLYHTLYGTYGTTNIFVVVESITPCLLYRITYLLRITKNQKAVSVKNILCTHVLITYIILTLIDFFQSLGTLAN